jgi:hypothetical protein
LDQQKIMELLDMQTDESFALAKTLYEEGAFSKTQSNLTIDGGLTVAIPKGTKLQGVAGSDDVSAQQVSSSAPVDVYAVADYAIGDTTIKVQYINEGCYVGANPDPITIGCLSSTGTLSGIDDATISVPYTYDVLADTDNAYSIQLFTQPTEFIFENDPLTRDYQKFVDFFGSETYMDDIIKAALAGTSTNFPTGKNLDMSGYSLETRAGKQSNYENVYCCTIYALTNICLTVMLPATILLFPLFRNGHEGFFVHGSLDVRSP